MNKDVEDLLATKEYKLTKLTNEQEVLERAIREFKKKPREPWYDDELWTELKNL